MRFKITGRIVLEALLLTSAVVSALTGYTFWASKKGKDFSFLGPILFTSLFVLILTGFMQVGVTCLSAHHLVPGREIKILYDLFCSSNF